MKIQHAIIMAGGRGSRMMPLTDVIPKAMAPFYGSTLIAHRIDKLKKVIPNIHITVGYMGPILAKHVIEHEVSSIFNTTNKDNSWWIFNTPLKYLDAPIVVLTCDNIVELDYESLEHDYYSMDAPPCMVVPVKPIEGLEGDFIFYDNNNRVTELTRKKKNDIYCSGIQIMNPAQINGLMEPCDNFYQLWQNLIIGRKLCCSNIYPENWFAIDTLSQLNLANGRLIE